MPTNPECKVCFARLDNSLDLGGFSYALEGTLPRAMTLLLRDAQQAEARKQGSKEVKEEGRRAESAGVVKAN